MSELRRSAERDEVSFLAWIDPSLPAGEDGAGNVVALTFSFVFPDLFYLGFLAVDGRTRSAGYGSRILTHFRERYAGIPQLLEIEPLTRKAANYQQRVAPPGVLRAQRLYGHEHDYTRGRPDLPGPGAGRYCDAGAPGGSSQLRDRRSGLRVARDDRLRPRLCLASRRAAPPRVRPGLSCARAALSVRCRGWRPGGFPRCRGGRAHPRGCRGEDPLVAGLKEGGALCMDGLKRQFTDLVAREGTFHFFLAHIDSAVVLIAVVVGCNVSLGCNDVFGGGPGRYP